MTVTFSKLGGYGRMGNAFFEAAATIGYAKKYNVPFKFPKWEHQSWIELDDKYFVSKNEIQPKNRYAEPSYRYTEIPFKPNCDLHGYFQSWKYFEHCQDYIREVFALKNKEVSEYFKDTCCVHVRRGDYVKFQKFHPVQTMDYYRAAMERIPCERFLVFSDDVLWCRKNFRGNDNVIVSEPASAEVDFCIMQACNHFVIGNSSFSWWAAWLSEHEDKVVVAPSNWFGPKLKKTNPIDDLIPPEWILI